MSLILVTALLCPARSHALVHHALATATYSCRLLNVSLCRTMEDFQVRRINATPCFRTVILRLKTGRRVI